MTTQRHKDTKMPGLCPRSCLGPLFGPAGTPQLQSSLTRVSQRQEAVARLYRLSIFSSFGFKKQHGHLEKCRKVQRHCVRNKTTRYLVHLSAPVHSLNKANSSHNVCSPPPRLEVLREHTEVYQQWHMHVSMHS